MSSTWSSVLHWEPRSGLGDKCFLPMEAFEKLQTFLTGDYADQPAPKQPNAVAERMDSSTDSETSSDLDTSGDVNMPQAPPSASKGKEKEGAPSRTSVIVKPREYEGEKTQERRKGQPLTLQFTNMRTGAKVFGGVLEFSASSGTVALPEYLSKALMAGPDDTILVRLVNLPKATFAKLQPLQADYLEIPDFRAALESLMRSNYTTLTQGEIISLIHQGKNHNILVTELKPAPGVSTTDTELEVDVVPLESLSISAQKETRALELDGPSLLGQVASETSDYYAFTCKETTNFRVSLKILSGDADLFVSNSSLKPSVIDNAWFSVEKGDCEVQIFYDHSAAEGEKTFGGTPKNMFHIAVRGYDPDTQYQISVAQLPKAQANQTPETTIPAHTSADHKQCSNCQQWIPLRTFDMHSAFCLRNNSLCTVCHRVVQKNQMEQHYHCPTCEQLLRPEEREKHQRMKHQPFPCTCGLEFDLGLLREHRQKYCPERMMTCRYCQDYVRAGPPSEKFGFDVSEHEEYCGSRTIDCAVCKRAVALKDLAVHEKLHEYQKQTKSVPFVLCKNQCCVNSEDVSNSLGLCQRCFGPFWSPSIDPGNKKLIQRLVGRYHQQITLGCKSGNCRNPYCHSAVNSEVLQQPPLDATGSAMLALKLTQKSSLQLKKSDAEYYFCVDDSVSKRRLLATSLRNMGYPLEWCVKALQESKDDVMNAANWLALHAPASKN